MNTINHILHTYHVTPLVIEEITDRVHRIDDGKQLFALKRADISQRCMQMLEYTYKQASDKQLRFIIPLYLTDTNQLFTRTDDSYYYLTPWISSQKTSLNRALHTIGTLHQKTTETYHINNERFKENWKDYKTYSQSSAQTYISYVEQFEKEYYMSPIGLQVCSHFRHLDSVFKTLQEQIGQLLDASATDEKSTHSLCHGQLKPSHLLGETDTVLLNWEKAERNHAAVDLAAYLKHHIIHETNTIDTYTEALEHYMNENKLNKQDLRLLAIYLLDPTRYMGIIDEAVNSQMERSMIIQVQQLQQSYRQLLFGLELTQFIQETYMLPDLEDLKQDT